MKRRTIFLENARRDLDAAFSYYEAKQRGLGYRFVDDVERSVSMIEAFPYAWTNVAPNLHRCLLKTFPYALLYRYDKDREMVIIVAVASLRQKPKHDP